MAFTERLSNLSATTPSELTENLDAKRIGVFDLRNYLDARSLQIPPGFYFHIPGSREQYQTKPELLDPYLPYFYWVILENYPQNINEEIDLENRSWLLIPSVEIVAPGKDTRTTLVKAIPIIDPLSRNFLT